MTATAAILAHHAVSQCAVHLAHHLARHLALLGAHHHAIHAAHSSLIADKPMHKGTMLFAPVARNYKFLATENSPNQH